MNDLELQRLEAVMDAARAMRKAASITSYPGIEADHSDSGYIVNVPARAWEALADTLNVLDKGREVSEMEDTGYSDGPWATGESDSSVDVAGYWHFPGPDVSGESEVKLPIHIVPLKQGYVVEDGEFEVALAAFTDAEDLAEWLLGWLGFEDEIVESTRDILAGLWDADELMDRDWNETLDVVRAAQAYVEANEPSGPYEWGGEYDKLVEAVKKWRGIEGG